MMEYRPIPAKTIVTKTKHNKWFGTDYNMNIYRGCSHGCIYCDSRSECYRIDHFDQVREKENALQIIRDDLRRKVKTGVVATGSMSDPYNPLEQKRQLTRHALELIDAYGFGVSIATKSTLLLRDIDILSGIAEHSPVITKITITAADDNLAKKIEPHVPCSSERFAMIRRLTDKGLFAGVLLMPVLPFLEDHEENIIRLVELAHQSGAKFIYPAFGVTLRDRQREWYLQKLELLFPGRQLAERYLRQYGNSYHCSSPSVRHLWNIFTGLCKDYKILYDMDDIIHAYKKRYQMTQLRMFD